MNWQQLKAIVWLRWRLSQNQFVQSGSLSAVISLLLAVSLGVLAVGFGVGGLAGGIAAGRMAKPEVLLLICDGAIALFLFLWFLSLLTELQRSESIDISKLMHLPVTLRQIFLFNYVAAHLSPLIILFVPLAGGFCVGMVFGGGLRMVWLSLILAGFLLMVTSWTYCLRGWLSALMANRRRAGMIAVWITAILILIGQVPSFVANRAKFNRRPVRHSESNAAARGVLTPGVVLGHILAPPGWVGYGAMTLKQGRQLPALAIILVSGLVAAAGIRQAERVTRRYYTAAVAGDGPGKAVPGKPRDSDKRARRRLLVEWSLPFVANDTSGVALATFRCLLRGPEVKLALLMPFVMVTVMSAQGLLKLRTNASPLYAPFIVTGALIMGMFLIAPTMSNVFGLDRAGFRALVLCPMRRSRILFGKNIAFIPLVASMALLVGAFALVVLHASLAVIVTGFFQAVAAWALIGSVANYVSILAPYRYSMNSLKAKKFKLTTMISALASMIVTPLIGLVLMIPTLTQFVWVQFEMPAWVPLNIAVSVLVAALCLWLYRALLPHQGEVLERRELTVLREVTTEME